MPDNWRGDPDMHPWHMIAEELLARGWSVEDLAIRMVIPNYDEILRELPRTVLMLDMYRVVGPNRPNCRIGEKSGREIARVFGIHEDMIINMEAAWREAALTKETPDAPR